MKNMTKLNFYENITGTGRKLPFLTEIILYFLNNYNYIISILLIIIIITLISILAINRINTTDRNFNEYDYPNRYLDQANLWWENLDSQIRQQEWIYNAVTREYVRPHEHGYRVLANSGPFTRSHYRVANHNINMVNRFIANHQNDTDIYTKYQTYFCVLSETPHKIETERLFTFDEASPYFKGCLTQAIMQYGEISEITWVPTNTVGRGILNGWHRKYVNPNTLSNGV